MIPFSETKKNSIKEAISSWDNATDAIDFLETNNESAEIVIAGLLLMINHLRYGATRMLGGIQTILDTEPQKNFVKESLFIVQKRE